MKIETESEVLELEGEFRCNFSDVVEFMMTPTGTIKIMNHTKKLAWGINLPEIPYE